VCDAAVASRTRGLTSWQAAFLRGLTDPEAAKSVGIFDHTLSALRLNARLISLAILHAAEGMLVSAEVLDCEIMSKLEVWVRWMPLVWWRHDRSHA